MIMSGKLEEIVCKGRGHADAIKEWNEKKEKKRSETCGVDQTKEE